MAEYEDVINLAFNSTISWMSSGSMAGIVCEYSIGNGQIIHHGKLKFDPLLELASRTIWSMVDLALDTFLLILTCIKYN